jgi:hypothetical protein
MLQSGHINFFNVDKCGLYSFTKAAPKGLDLSETFEKLKAWAESRSFETTNPWDPKFDRNKTPCYCRQVHYDEKTGDFLLVLWKGENDKSGPLYGMTIDADGKPEKKPIKQTEKKSKQKVIWGRPCYYWIIPEANCVASIKFENSRCDSAMFQDWVAGSINFRVDLPDLKKVSTQTGLVRIEFPDDYDNPYKYHYQFDLSLRSLSTSSAPLKELASKVTHIIRRETVSLNVTNEREGWVKHFGRLALPYASNPDTKSRKVELTVEARPTIEEVRAIIETYGSISDVGNWEDVGFVLEGGTKTVWARTYRHSENISINDDGNDILDAEVLYSTLKHHRANFIRPVLNDIQSSKTGTGE